MNFYDVLWATDHPTCTGLHSSAFHSETWKRAYYVSIEIGRGATYVSSCPKHTRLGI